MLPSDFPRPEKHPFDADPLTRGATCRECGMEFAFGGLHPEPVVEPPPEAEIRICPACQHYQHDGLCWGAIPGYPKPRPCPCGSEVAA